MENEMRIYVANLGKYNEGKLVGSWLDLPLYGENGDFEEDFAEFLKDKVGVENGTEYEEYAVHDYELPFKFGEFESVERLNELAELIEDNGIDSSDLLLMGKYDDSFDGFYELVEAFIDGDVILHHDTEMEDIAYEYLRSTGFFDDVNEIMERYFDYEAYGRDMRLEGGFAEYDGDIIEDRR